MSHRKRGVVVNSTSWKDKVREEYGKRCVICGSLNNIQIHHVITRKNYRVRRYVPNGVPLCHNHHSLNKKSAHKNPEWFKEFIIVRRGQDWWDDLLVRSRKSKKDE